MTRSEQGGPCLLCAEVGDRASIIKIGLSHAFGPCLNYDPMKIRAWCFGETEAQRCAWTDGAVVFYCGT